MTDDELKTRLRHSADVLRDILHHDLAEGCSRTSQRIDALVNEIDALRAELDRAFDELGMLGVPRERARTVANGINVLMTRISKSEVAMLSELEAARAKLVPPACCQEFELCGEKCVPLTEHWRVRAENAEHELKAARDAANRIEGGDVLARLRSGSATPEDQYNVANSLAYLWAQDGSLLEAQQEVDQLRDQLAEVERPLDAQMARLNANLLAANRARMNAERELDAARADAELLWANCRIIYFPDPSGSYPLEHNMRACGTKDSRADIEAALRIDAARKERTT